MVAESSRARIYRTKQRLSYEQRKPWRTDTLRGLIAQLETAGHSQKGKLIAQTAELLQCGTQTVYRKLKKLGWKSGRKTRADRGNIAIPEEVAKAAAHLVHKGTRANGKRTMTITNAREILAESEKTQDIAMPQSASTLSRAMRFYGCHPDALAQGKPHVHLKSLHPNHVWQVDASLCVLFYLPKGKIQLIDEKQFYKNKPEYAKKAKKERVWRYIITDHYSGNFYLHYAQAAGENSQDLIECFLQTITKRSDDDPMYGVPNILMMDKGSANTSALFLNLLDRLGVEHMTHGVGASRVKGQVEQCQNLVETNFESRLSFLKVSSLEELRERANAWRKHFCAHKTHTRTCKPRNNVWLTIKEDELRLAPGLDLCRELVNTTPKEVKIKPDMTITHSMPKVGRHSYDLRTVPGIVPQMKVQVVVNPYRSPAVDIITEDPATGKDKIWTVEPIKQDKAGFFEDAPVIGQEHKALADTTTDKAIKDIEEAAIPTEKGQKAAAPAGVNVFADIKEAPSYIPKRGRDLGLDPARRELKPLTITEAARQLKNMLGDEYPKSAYTWLAQRYKDGVPVDEMDAIARHLSKAQAPAVLKIVGE